jgi:hypothetical protein
VRSLRRPLFAALGLTAALLTIVTVGTSPVDAAPTWAPEATATIHPGVQTDTAGGQCTANFIYTAGSEVYIGQAAHCASTGGQTDTDGCLAGSQPLGTEVTIEGAEHPGTLAYSSWLTMQSLGETDADTCAYNDLALVRVDRADRSKVNPSVPFWGGPVGLSRAGAPAGSQVYSWGQSSLRPTTALSPKTGTSLGGGGWTWDVYTATPGIPGDSGSGFLDADGRALGVLSTVAIAPVAGSNGVGDLRHELAFARAHSGLAGLRLVRGTEAFSSPL